jgi:hypothetical protein
MPSGKDCPFHRDSENLGMGRGIGYCDLDCDRTTCKGDLSFCEKPDTLRKYQLEQKRKEGGMGWPTRGNVHSIGSQRA